MFSCRYSPGTVMYAAVHHEGKIYSSFLFQWLWNSGVEYIHEYLWGMHAWGYGCNCLLVLMGSRCVNPCTMRWDYTTFFLRPNLPLHSSYSLNAPSILHVPPSACLNWKWNIPDVDEFWQQGQQEMYVCYYLSGIYRWLLRLSNEYKNLSEVAFPCEE